MDEIEEVAFRYLARFEDATPIVALQGARWYPEGRRFVRRTAATYGVPRSVVAGIVSVLSPRVRWETNKRMAVDVLEHGTTRGLGLSVRKAEAIFSGVPARQVVSGRKVTEFYRSLMGNDAACVIDVWMYKAAGFDGQAPSAREYDICADGLRMASAQVGWKPAPFQAVVWTHIRGGGD